MTDLCERCDVKPILVVDGFEEIDDHLCEWLEENVLAQFVAQTAHESSSASAMNIP